MATAQVRRLFPGCTVRTGTRGKTIRFDAMVKGNRFVGTSKLTLSEAIDPKGRPTMALKQEYAKWRIDQESERLGPDNVGLRDPSIQELIETYEEIAWKRHNGSVHRDPRPRTIETAIKNFWYCVEASGVAPSRPYTELFSVNTIRRLFDRLCQKMTRDGKLIKPITAWSYVSSLQSVSADWTIPMYNDKGMSVVQPNFKAIDFGDAKNAEVYTSLPQEQQDQIMLWYETLEEKLGKECRLAALLSLKLGMRPIDVKLASVSMFPVKNGKRHLEFKPSKTFDRSHRRVCVAIAPALWEEICHLAGDDIETGDIFIKKPRMTYLKLNQSIRYCCGMKYEDGWDKAAYELRKLCYDMIWHDPKQGPDVAVALSGENRATLEHYYTDPYSVDNVIGA